LFWFHFYKNKLLCANKKVKADNNALLYAIITKPSRYIEWQKTNSILKKTAKTIALDKNIYIFAPQ
jgi:hypothetical protein